MVHNLARAGTKLHRADPFVLLEVERDHEIAEDVGAARRKIERNRHFHDEIGLAQVPSFRELGKLGHLRGIALRHALLDPIGNGRDLLVRQTAFIGELAVIVRGVPGRHITGFRDGRDQGAALLDVFIGNQRERSSLTRAMARHAVVVHDGSDVFAECDFAGRRKKRGCSQ